MTKVSDLPDFEQIVDDIRTWLRAHGSDPHAGLMIRDFLNGDCAHDFVIKETMVCELCSAPTEDT